MISPPPAANMPAMARFPEVLRVAPIAGRLGAVLVLAGILAAPLPALDMEQEFIYETAPLAGTCS